MADEHWQSIRKTTTQVHLEYGPAYATLFATDIRLRRGPPLTLALSLQSNLYTCHKGVGTYIDAKALAEGNIDSLDRLQLLDSAVISRLLDLVGDSGFLTVPWHLVLDLDGTHEFRVQPQLPDITAAPSLFFSVLRE